MTHQDDTRALLEELRGDASEEAAPRGRTAWIFLTVLALALTGGGTALYLSDVPSTIISKLGNSKAETDPLPSAEVPRPEKAGAVEGDDRTPPASASPIAAPATALEATGYVVARREAAVSAKFTGKIAEVLIEEGQKVSANQLLARLDDSVPRAELELAIAERDDAKLRLADAELQYQQAVRDLDRIRQLAQDQFASRAALEQQTLLTETRKVQRDQAEQAILVAERRIAVQRQLVADTEIRAPFAGIVTAKSGQPGEIISPTSAGGGFTRTRLCTIVDMTSLEIEVDVNESYIDRISVGQDATAVLNAYTDARFPARVIAIIPAADRNKATIRVRMGFLQLDPRILPGMGASPS